MKKTYVITLAIAAALTGCGGSGEDKTDMENASEGTTTAAGHAMDATKEAAGSLAEKAKEVAGAAVETTKEAAGSAVDATKEAAGAAVDKAKEMAGGAVDATKEAASAVAEKSKEVASGTVEAAKDAGAAATAAVASATGTAKSSVDASALYGTCAGCHGQKGELKALGTSPIIAGQPAADIVKKLKGYKDGSYGGAMKSVMTGQVASLSDADMEALAEMISKF